MKTINNTINNTIDACLPHLFSWGMAVAILAAGVSFDAARGLW